PRESEHEGEVVDHEVEDDGDLRAAPAEGREAVRLDEARAPAPLAQRAERGVPALEVTDLQEDAAPPRLREDRLRLRFRRGERLLDEHVEPPPGGLDGRVAVS